MAVLQDLKNQREFRLRGKITLLGRDPACDIVVPSRETSGRHAMILHSGGVYFVEDLDSTNGTLVNGRRLEERVPLKSGDQLELPGLLVTYRQNEPAPFTVDQTIGHMTMVPSAANEPRILSALDPRQGMRTEVAPETKLKAILEISRHLGNALALEEVLPRILESLFVIFPQADRGFVLLRDPETGQLAPRASRQRREQPGSTPSISQTILDHVLRTGQAVLSADAGHDERFDQSQSVHRLGIRSVLCVPLVSQAGTNLGVIQIDTREARQLFRQADLDVLVSASTQAARAVELAGLHLERRDLEAAAQIQKSFLPSARPQVAGLRFFDYYASAQHIGGDYYDYIALPGDRLAVALGDVSGKGVSAALLMARVSAAARFCLATEASVPAAVQRLNGILIRSGNEDRFVTFVVLVLDLASWSVTVVNAGHLLPLRRRGADGVVEDIGEAAAGLPLGVFDRPYEETAVSLLPGDSLVLCTDGVTEARNPARELYGAERLRAMVQSAPADIEALGKAILADVQRFTAGHPLGDDCTLVCFGRLS